MTHDSGLCAFLPSKITRVSRIYIMALAESTHPGMLLERLLVHARKDVWLWLSPECGTAYFAANLISHDLITGDLFTETLAGPQLSEFLEWRDCKSYFLPESGWSQEAKGKLPCFFLPIAIFLAKLLRVNLFLFTKSIIYNHFTWTFKKHWKVSFFKIFKCLWTLIK